LIFAIRNMESWAAAIWILLIRMKRALQFQVMAA
jgi:hypothetical protein